MPSSCRNCGEPLGEVFVDLGMSPLANRFLTEEQLTLMEPFYPLRALLCGSCLLVQLEEYQSPESIFSDYVYFSSCSQTWVAHAGAFAATAVERLGLGLGSRVVEVASNDGYLLAHFAERGIDVLGVEPAANVAGVAIERGIPTLAEFFGSAVAATLADNPADLLVGNNVLAHVPDLHDFVEGMRILLAPNGVISMEFPHLLRLLEGLQFDTIYHEHFSYFSLHVVQDVFRRHALAVFDVEELPTHGGSLRIWARHDTAPTGAFSERMEEVLTAEVEAGLATIDGYRGFAQQVQREKHDLVSALIEHKRDGARIVGYGAPAKANTLLNYCGIGTDLIEFTADVSPHKQGLYLPGTHIPVCSPEALVAAKPDLVFILPWNLQDEIMEAMAVVREWGGRFLVRRPHLTVVA